MNVISRGLARGQRQPFRLILWAILALGALGSFFYFSPTPSSYANGMEMLGQPVSGLYFGEPQAIRSDEWLVYTPYVQMAVARNSISDSGPPYRVPLRSFMSLPVRDWGMIFKPYYWGFLVLPAAQAYALTFLFHSLTFVVGWAVLFKMLGVKPSLALPGALTFYWAQFTQVWWTTNAGSFAYGPWVVIAWIAVANPIARTAAVAYLMCVWLIASGYPPFIYAFALALAVLTATCRRDLLTAPRIATSVAAVILTAAVSYAYFADVYAILSNTVYPGHRRVTGGGVPWQELLAHLLPWFSTIGFQPIPDVLNSNACEIGVIGSILPAAAVVYTPWTQFRLSRAQIVPVALVFGTIALVIAWALALVPGWVAQFTLLDRVHPNRLLATLGILLVFVSLKQLSSSQLIVNFKRHLVLLSLLLVPVLWRAAVGNLGTFDFVAPILVVGLGLWQWRTALPPPASVIVGAAALANLLTFGSFNPVQSAYPIFNLDTRKIETNLLARGARYYEGALIVPGHYGALVGGAGLPSYNQVLLQPRQYVFRTMFPKMPDYQFEQTFNRYAHISFGDVCRPTLANTDLIVLPLEIGTPGAESMAMVKSIHLSQGADQVVARYSIFCGPESWGSWSSRLPRNFAMRLVPGSAEVDGVVHSSIMKPGFTSVNMPDFPMAKNNDGEIFLEVRPFASMAAASESVTVDSFTMDATNHLVAVGWLTFDARDGVSFTLYTDGTVKNFSVDRIDRPDVAKLVSPALFKSGFKVEIDLAKQASPYCLMARSTQHVAAKIGGMCR